MAKEQRLIDANKAFETVTDLAGQADTKSAYAAFWKAGRAIQNMNTVDAVEVVHGRWVKKWHDNNLIGHEYEECSVCGSCVISDTEKFWDCNYCPQCGAKMDGERRADGPEG